MNVKSENKPVLLKIFNGPHMGAEILLNSGEYIVGRCSSCDIALQDESIDQRHAKISVLSNGVSVCPLENSEVLMQDKPLTLLSESAIGFYQILQFGTTRLAFGYPDGEWQQIHRDINYGARKTGLLNIGGWSIALAFQSIYIAFDNFVNQYFSVKSNDVLMSVPGLDVTPLNGADLNNDFDWDCQIPKGTISSRDINSKSRRIKTMTVTFMTFGLLALSYVYASDIFASKLGMNEHAVDADIYLLLEQPKFKGVSFVKTHAQEDMLTGFVATVEDQQELVNRSVDSPLHLNVKVRVGSSLADSADKILEVVGFPDLTVTYLPHGRIGIAGYVVESAAWTEVKHMLMQDIPGLKAIDETGIQNFDDRKNILLKAVEAAGLHKKLNAVEGDDNELVVMGLLDSLEMNTWKHITAKFTRDFGDKPLIQSRVGDAREMLNFEIKAVRVGSDPYLVTADGLRYLAGGLLPNGFKVKQIFIDKIIFSKYGMDAVYSLGY
jgi:type III secretion system YscD/HrpQ family protein